MSDSTKKLYRSTDDRWLGGVCGGLGQYFNIDALLVRILFIIIGLISFGGGVILYIILWIIIPEQSGGGEAAADFSMPEAEPEAEAPAEEEAPAEDAPAEES